MTSSISNEFIDSLINLLDGKKDESAYTSRLISKVPLVMKAIEKANAVHKLSGKEKKDLVIRVICAYIKKEDDPGDAAALYFTKHVLPPLIDTLVMVDTKKLRIKAESCCVIM
jgi:hypothetical protein